MSHTNLAKETLLQFMQAMYAWERKATRSLRNQAYKEMLKDELVTIFDQFCTSKKTLRAREVSLSIRFPFDYKIETHPIVDEEHDGNQAYFYLKENRIVICFIKSRLTRRTFLRRIIQRYQSSNS